MIDLPCHDQSISLPLGATAVAEAAVLACGLAVVARRAQRLQVARDVVAGVVVDVIDDCGGAPQALRRAMPAQRLDA
ncbi:hypothetical protein X636_24840 [Pandoraea pnomenusa]|nr:hypothetical protein X636_24840 [Pandoraea pnomenusa]